MTKKFISMFLALVMCLTLSAPAFAVTENEADILSDLSEVDEDNIPLEIMEKYYSLPREEAEKSPTKLDDIAIVSATSENVTATMLINELAAQATETIGPFTKIYAIPVAYFDIILENMASNLTRNFYPQVYNGKSCYLFSNGETNVYVEAAAFCSTAEDGKIYPSTSALSKTLTTYINRGDTRSLCNTHVTCIIDETLPSTYQWSVAQISSDAFVGSDAYTHVTSKIRASVYFTADFNCLTPYRVNQETSCRPELSLEITDGGSNNAYFGSYKIEGRGKSTSSSPRTINIASLINLGYNTSQLCSGNFSFGTFASIFEQAYNLLENPQAQTSQSTYTSDIYKPLSNTHLNIWSRQCSAKAPYKMAFPEDSYQMTVGILQNSSTVKYAVTVTYYFYT